MKVAVGELMSPLLKRKRNLKRSSIIQIPSAGDGLLTTLVEFARAVGLYLGKQARAYWSLDDLKFHEVDRVREVSGFRSATSPEEDLDLLHSSFSCL
jgi:phytoene/squalene synthetase